MKCKHCGYHLSSHADFCGSCGAEKKRHMHLPLSISITLASCLLFIFGAGIVVIEGNNWTQTGHAISESTASLFDDEEHSFHSSSESIPRHDSAPVLTKEQITAKAQRTVYTVYTESNQGSGFLYNTKGDVVTNAHVVEGNAKTLIKTHDGTEYLGKVIGYSSETDVALVRVPDLAGTTPFPTNKTDQLTPDEEVIALGSPNDQVTVSTGTITDDDVHFSIGSYQYTNLYEMTADINEGSSGGPLISANTGKIVAINSAENIDDGSIGYSLPLYTVADLLEKWSARPMDEYEISRDFDGAEHENQESWYIDDGQVN